jgi:hypothetical protein
VENSTSYQLYTLSTDHWQTRRVVLAMSILVWSLVNATDPLAQVSRPVLVMNSSS